MKVRKPGEDVFKFRKPGEIFLKFRKPGEIKLVKMFSNLDMFILNGNCPNVHQGRIQFGEHGRGSTAGGRTFPHRQVSLLFYISYYQY